MTPMETKSRIHQDAMAGFGTGAGGLSLKSFAKFVSFQRERLEFARKIDAVLPNGMLFPRVSSTVEKRFAAPYVPAYNAQMNRNAGCLT